MPIRKTTLRAFLFEIEERAGRIERLNINRIIAGVKKRPDIQIGRRGRDNHLKRGATFSTVMPDHFHRIIIFQDGVVVNTRI